MRRHKGHTSKKDDRAAIKSRKEHHHLKVLHKAVKRARDFEIRKLIRRLKHMEAPASKDGATCELRGKRQDAAKVENIQAQLYNAKHMDMQLLTQMAGVECGIKRQADAASAGGTDGSNALAARIMAAKCVRDAVQAACTALSRFTEPPTPKSTVNDSMSSEQQSGSKEPLADATGVAGGKDEEGGTTETSCSEPDEDDKDRARRTLAADSGPPARSKKRGADHGLLSQDNKKKKKNRLGQRARRLLATQQSAQPLPTQKSAGHPGAARKAIARAAGAIPLRHSRSDGPADRRLAAPHAVSQRGEALEGLHPSWQAKKLHAGSIVKAPACMATKIIFND